MRPAAAPPPVPSPLAACARRRRPMPCAVTAAPSDGSVSRSARAASRVDSAAARASFGSIARTAAAAASIAATASRGSGLVGVGEAHDPRGDGVGVVDRRLELAVEVAELLDAASERPPPRCRARYLAGGDEGPRERRCRRCPRSAPRPSRPRSRSLSASAPAASSSAPASCARRFRASSRTSGIGSIGRRKRAMTMATAPPISASSNRWNVMLDVGPVERDDQDRGGWQPGSAPPARRRRRSR